MFTCASQVALTQINEQCVNAAHWLSFTIHAALESKSFSLALDGSALLDNTSACVFVCVCTLDYDGPLDMWLTIGQMLDWMLTHAHAPLWLVNPVSYLQHFTSIFSSWVLSCVTQKSKPATYGMKVSWCCLMLKAIQASYSTVVSTFVSNGRLKRKAAQFLKVFCVYFLLILLLATEIPSLWDQ